MPSRNTLHGTNEKTSSIFSALLKVLSNVLAIRIVLWAALQLENRAKESSVQLQALHTLTWLATSVPFINFCHSGWAVVGELGQWMSPSDLFEMDRYNPSPWGPIGATVELGLAGKYIFRL
jgi:hypothetical protein